MLVTPAQQAKLIFGYEHERPDYDFFGFGSTDSQRANIDSVYALGIVQPFTGLSLTGGVRHDDHSQFGGATTFGANGDRKCGVPGKRVSVSVDLGGSRKHKTKNK